MRIKTVIITGADSGLGNTTAGEITKAGHRAVLACRSAEQAEAAQRSIGGNSIAVPLDLSRRSSIHAFTDWAHRELGEIDVLINQAADFNPARTERELTADGFEISWFTNHLGPVLLVDRLLDMLISSPQGRILTLSSQGLNMLPFQTVDLKDPMFGNRPYSAIKAYYQSTMAQLMYTRWLAEQLTGTMATANSICISRLRLDADRLPGLPAWLRNLYALKACFGVTEETMAQTCLNAALDPALKNRSGKQIGPPLKEIGLPAYAVDPLCIAQLMQLTYRQLGIDPAISYEPAEERHSEHL